MEADFFFFFSLARTIPLTLALATGVAACGGGTGNPGHPTSVTGSVCAGTPAACGLLSAAACVSTSGCSPGACSGTAAACEGFAPGTECLLQQGCTPTGSGGTCSGLPLSCLALSSDPECRAQLGCAWQVGCSGRATACELLNLSACQAQPGCHIAAAGDGGTGDAAAETGPPARDCPDAGIPTALIIDDMEDQTPAILGSDLYGGWYVYDDMTTSAHMTPAPNAPFTMAPIPGGRCASEYAMRLSGTGFTMWGAGMGFDFGYGGTAANGHVIKVPALNAAKSSGFRFWARVGQATTTRVGLSVGAGSCPPDAAGDGGDDGGSATPDAGGLARAPNDCALNFPKNLSLTNDWALYDINFDDLVSDPGRMPIPRDQIYSIQFLIPAATTFDVWIDDMSWIPAPSD